MEFVYLFRKISQYLQYLYIMHIYIDHWNIHRNIYTNNLVYKNRSEIQDQKNKLKYSIILYLYFMIQY